MNERCPKCDAGKLMTVEQSIVLCCAKCSGFWVPPLAFNEAGIIELLQARDVRPQQPLEQDHRTGPCPEGHGLLRRARVTNEDPYFLERCARCGGVWFDAGEWSRTAAEGLLANLSEVWSPAWRKQLSDAQSHAALEVDLRAKLGAELFDLLHAVAGRLETHPQRTVALAFLSERLKHPEDFGDE